MELVSPAAKFKFKAGQAAADKKKHLIRVIPVFREQDVDAMAALLPDGDAGAVKKILETHRGIGGFKGGDHQLLHIAEHNVLFGGLGKRGRFHPENCAALFRALGERLARFQNIIVEVVIPDDLSAAIDDYAARDDGPALALDFKKKPRAKTAAQGASSSKKKAVSKAGNKSADDEADDGIPDYSGPYTVEDLVQQMAVCLEIGAESMHVLKSKKDQKKDDATKNKITDVAFHAGNNKKLSAAVERGRAVAELLNGARYIASLPGNYLHPANYETYARQLAKQYGLKIQVWNAPALEKLGCGGILAVGQGSEIPPRMIALEYKPPKNVKSASARPLVLVGKGITFDTGGISIKPSGEMHEMKFDMCGSALVVHAVALAAARKLPIEVVGLIGVAENMPDGRAIKPGDVYTAYNGLTVEVQNTDAEGRLVLGDVLSYACETYDPLCIMDFATLTGAAIIALGHEAGGVMTASEDLYARISAASRRSLDRVWRLPHWDTYTAPLKSDTADVRNIGGRPAGTVTAMRFLSKFVDAKIPWAHVDIAGTAWRGKPSGSQGKGATGWGIRLMDQLMEDLGTEGRS